MFNEASSSPLFANMRSRAIVETREIRPAQDCHRPASLPGRRPAAGLTAAANAIPHHSLGRAVDIPIASIVLLAMLPALIVIALLIWFGDGGSPFFAQRRVGRGGALFPCFKFRTMVRDSEARLRAVLASDAAAAEEWELYRKLRHDPRITPIGHLLRKTSLDEIPQLANVLLGHMSLVGPRPIVEEEIGRYRRYFASYCSVRPGITGLWQVSGRNDVSYRRRVALDIVYCRAKSVQLDLFILARTVPAVVSGRGCS